MMVCLYCCENGTENHNLWQRCRCILNDKAMILANACRDFRFATKLFYSDLQLWQILHFNGIKIATHLTFILWLAYRFKSYVLLLSGTDDFQGPDRLPRLGTGSEWDRLAKSLLSGRFPLQSDLKHFGTESEEHKTKEQMRQKLIGMLDTVSAEILSWASRTKVLITHHLDIQYLQTSLFI